MAKAGKFDIEMTHLHAGREEIEHTSIDDYDDVLTKKEPSPDDIPYVGGPVTPVPFPGSDEGLPAPENSLSERYTEMQKADENEHKYLEIVHDVKTKKGKSGKVRQVEGPEAPVPCTSSAGFYAERLPVSESSSVSEATFNIEMTYLHKVDEKVPKYLEIVDDVTTKKESSSNGHDGYEVPVSRAHHYEDPEEWRHSDLNVPGSSAARPVNPAVLPGQATAEPMGTTAPLNEEIK